MVCATYTRVCRSLVGDWDQMKRAFTNILSDDVERTARFYEVLLDLKRAGDFGWFILLSDADMPGFELGVLDKDHDTIPNGVHLGPAGAILTFVVEDVEHALAKAQALNADIVEQPTDLPYGQRRMVLRDPDGTIVDVSSPIT